MNRAEELRLAFDRSFADAPDTASHVHVDVVAIDIGGEAYAVPIADVGAIHVDVLVSPVPARVRELAGIASVRGALVPVYDLRLILGVKSERTPRWLVLASSRSAAYAFDAFEGLVRVSGGLDMEGATGLVRASFVDHGSARFVLDLAAVEEFIRARSGKEP